MKKLLAFSIVAMAAGLVCSQAMAAKGDKGERERCFTPDGSVKAHFEQQHQENLAFHQTLKDLAPEARIPAVKAHREEQFKENLAFLASQHDKRVAQVQACDKLTDAQKQEAISFLDVQYAENVEFFTRLHKANMDFLDGLAADTATPAKEKLEAIRAHAEDSKAQIKAHWEQQKGEFRDFIRQLRGEGR